MHGYRRRGSGVGGGGGLMGEVCINFSILSPVFAVNKNAVQNIPQSRCSASEDTAAQLSHSPGQRHRGRIYCSWLCATCAHRRSLLRCSNLSACTCRCSCVVVLICACICSFSPLPCMRMCAFANDSVVRQPKPTCFGTGTRCSKQCGCQRTERGSPS